MEQNIMQQAETNVERAQEIKKSEIEKQQEETKEERKQKKLAKMLTNKPTKSMNFPELVEAVLDPDGKVVYLVKERANRANRRKGILFIVREWQIEDEILIPPSKAKLPYKLAKAADVFYYYYTKIFYDHIYKQVEGYLRKAGSLDEDQYLLASLYVFATYLRDHKDIHHMPILLFCAEPERGKTRIGKAMTYISFRGIHTVSISQASIFRYTDRHRATMFYDVMNFWNDVVKHGVEDVFLLGFEKGATISRVLYQDRGPFDDTESFEVYAPMIIATNDPVHNILGTRCLEILPPNVPGIYVNYSANDKLVLGLKAQLTAWKAEWIDKSLPTVQKVPGINGRLWDIGKTLLIVCKMVCPEKYDLLVNALLKQAQSRVQAKAESLEGRIVSIIQELSSNAVMPWIMTSEVLEKLNDGVPEVKKYNAHWLGRKLKMMGVNTERTSGRSRMLLDQPELKKLYDQYSCNEVDVDIEENSRNSENYNKVMRLVI
ncbi:MAG: DUF3631 domain-containing protein [Prolixibacteraceae bacterium]|nr:DUF3631 domain-containing protein [Prolixibacteraceae bacterium]